MHRFPRHSLSPTPIHDTDPDRFRRAGIPWRYYDVTRRQIPDKLAYKDELKDVILNLHKHAEVGKAPLFHGEFGVGKTSAAVVLMGAVMKRALCSCYFVRACQLHRFFGPGGFVEKDQDGIPIRDIVLGSQYLILDDWGSQRRAEWSDAWIEEVIAVRYDEQRPTIITTNMSPDEIVKRMKRFESLISGTFLPIHVHGYNWRTGRFVDD